MKYFLSLFLLIFFLSASAQSFTKLNAAALNKSGSWRAVAPVDYDNNYTLDLLVGNGNQLGNGLFQNNGDSTFNDLSSQNVTSLPSIAGTSFWADFDNDCDLDVFWPTTSGAVMLFTNEGDSTFSQVTSGSIVNNFLASTAATWIDYNNDGNTDLFIAAWNNGDNNYLFRNNGGSFTLIDTGVIATSSGQAWVATWADIENDGDPDLFIGTKTGNNYLLINNGGGNFVNDTASIITQEGNNTFGATWGDYNNDGYPDLYVARNPDTENYLYENNGDGTFSKITSGAIVNDQLRTGGTTWADLDNDGDLDMYTSQTGNGAITSNRNIIYRNNGNGSFTKVTSGTVYSESMSAESASVADINNDGFLDIINANRFSQPISLLLNDGNNNNFLKLRLYGSSANTMAIGARIEVISVLGKQYRYISAMTGNRGQPTYEQHFGLGQDSLIDTLRVYWPGGGTCQFTQVPVNGFFNIGQGGCVMDSVPAAAYQDSSRYLNAYFQNESKGVVSSYHWDFGDGDTSNLANPSHLYTQPGSYQVTLVAYDNFCRYRVYKDSIEICPDTSSLGFYSSALGLNLSFTDTSLSNGFQFDWDFGDGSSGSGISANHTYSAAGTYQVCLSVTDSCRSKQLCQSITVCNDTLIAAFGSSTSGFNVSFNDSSINASSISWDFGDGTSATGANPSHTYSAPGYYFVCQTVQDICTSSTFCDTVEVCLDTAKADYSYTSNGPLYNFNDLSTNANSWFWDFGDGNYSTQANPAHIYQNLGSYNVCLTVTNDCYSDSSCKVIIVCDVQAQAAFSYQSTLSPFVIQFTDQSQDAVSYYWDFGDGSSSTNKNPTKIFGGPQLFNVCLTVTDSCGQQDSSCQAVDLTPFSTAELDWLHSLEIYPNPAREQLFINNPTPMEESLTLRFYDLQGKEVQTYYFDNAPASLQLPMGHFPEGIYFMKIAVTGGSKTYRIIKN